MSSRPSEPPGLPRWARVNARRRAHIERVAALLREWADAMGVSVEERRRWLRAAMLHDALKDAPAEELATLAGPDWPHPKIRHGPAAARRAEQDGETDSGVLDAVRYHSIGYAGWDRVGHVLYLADYLEPGRPYLQARHRSWSQRVPREPDAVLRAVADQRIRAARAAGHTLLPHTVDFWNALR